MTFWQWLRRQKIRRGPIGDLCNRELEDTAHKGNTWQWWREHLKARKACEAEQLAFERAWLEWGRG